MERGPERDHKKVFRVLERRCRKCIISGGDYFEGVKIDIHE